MNTDNQKQINSGHGWSRWLRVGLLTFSMAGPIINTLLNQTRNRSQMLRDQAGELRAASAQRLEELSLSSRAQAAAQAQLLRKQAQQLQAQAQQLRKALRTEAKQRQKLHKLQKQLRKSRVALSKDLLKRGELVTGELIEQSGKLSHNLLERGSKVTQDLTRRGSQATQEVVKRGSKTSQALLERSSDISQDLLKRGSEVSQSLLERGGEVSQNLVQRGSKLSRNVTERGGQLLEPVRRRDSRFWTIVGFTTGLVAAGIVTYVVVRRRVSTNTGVSQTDEHIEIPHNGQWNGSSTSRPAGEIHHIDSEGASVATLTSTKVESEEAPTEKKPVVQVAPEVSTVNAPADAAFVGIVSTKLYYPVNAAPEADDRIYFASADEAKADGFSPAPAE